MYIISLVGCEMTSMQLGRDYCTLHKKDQKGLCENEIKAVILQAEIENIL